MTIFDLLQLLLGMDTGDERRDRNYRKPGDDMPIGGGGGTAGGGELPPWWGPTRGARPDPTPVEQRLPTPYPGRHAMLDRYIDSHSQLGGYTEFGPGGPLPASAKFTGPVDLPTLFRDLFIHWNFPGIANRDLYRAGVRITLPPGSQN